MGKSSKKSDAKVVILTFFFFSLNFFMINGIFYAQL